MYTVTKKTCKGVPSGRCKYCNKQLKSKQSKYQHQKTCKQNPANYELVYVAAPDDQQGSVVPSNIRDNYNISGTGNTVNNNNIVNNIENNNNITFNGFCHENVSYLTANISTDNRLNNVCKRISDTIDLVHFNADHPENQTIRKLNKKSEFLEIRTPNNTWEMENDKIGIEKMQRNLEQTFQTKFDDADDLNRSALSEMLYQKTLRGEIPEEEILNKYDINTPHGRRMIEYNCDAQVRRKDAGVLSGKRRHRSHGGDGHRVDATRPAQH